MEGRTWNGTKKYVVIKAVAIRPFQINTKTTAIQHRIDEMGRISFDKKLKLAQQRDLDDIIRTCRYKNHRMIVNHIKRNFKVNTSITAAHRYMQQLRLKDIEWLSMLYMVNSRIAENEIDNYGFNHAFKDIDAS